jgi:hypothetical protein
MSTNNPPQPPPFTGFGDAYQNSLAALLDKVKGAYGQGTAAVGSAYASTHADASGSIADVVSTLTVTQIGYLNSVIGFRNPGNTDVTDIQNNNQIDIVNAALTLFDDPAAKYFHGKTSDGDAVRPTLQTGLQSYDTAITVSGSMAPGP